MWRRRLGWSFLAVPLSLGSIAAGGCDDDPKGSEERIQRECEEAAKIAGQEERLKQLEKELERREGGSGRGGAGPGSSSGEDRPGAKRLATLRFQTGTDPDQSVPATYCRVGIWGEGHAGLYCWTPNDGYSVLLDGNGPDRVRDDEAVNRGHTPTGYPLLGLGHAWSRAGFVCVSGRALSCRTANGSGFDLPRYRGLPRLL
jgi:hypothetical protein